MKDKAGISHKNIGEAAGSVKKKAYKE